MHRFPINDVNVEALRKAIVDYNGGGSGEFMPLNSEGQKGGVISVDGYDSSKPFAQDTGECQLEIRISKRTITPVLRVIDPVDGNTKRPPLSKAKVPANRPLSNPAKWRAMLDEEKVRIRKVYENFDLGKEEDAKAVQVSKRKKLKELFREYQSSEQYFQLKAGTKVQYDRVIKNHFLAYIPEGQKFCLGELPANAMSKTKADKWLKDIRTGQGRFYRLDENCSPKTDHKNKRIIVRHNAARAMSGQARRVVSKMFNVLCELSKLDWNPIALSERIKAPKKRERKQSREEIKAIWQACDKLPENERDYVRFLMLTAQRRKQVASLCFDWIDWEQNCIVFPGNEMKGKTDHTPDFIMPMSPPVRQMLEARKARAKGMLVFPTDAKRNKKNPTIEKTESVFSNYNRITAKVDAAILGKQYDWRDEKRDPECFGWAFHDFRRNADVLLKDADPNINQFDLKLLVAHKLTNDAAIAAYVDENHYAIISKRARLFKLLAEEVLKSVS